MTGRTAREAGVKTVFLIDDHPVVGLGLALALKGHSLLRHGGSATNRWAGLERAQSIRADALVLDLVFNGEAETGFIRECREALPQAIIVVFSSLPKRLYERDVLELGADSFVGKNADLSDLVAALAEIAARPKSGGTSLPVPVEPVGSVVLDGVHMTQREAEVARHLASGHSIARIAADLGISANTASVHRDNIRKKLKCRDMTELVAFLARSQRQL